MASRLNISVLLRWVIVLLREVGGKSLRILDKDRRRASATCAFFVWETARDGIVGTSTSFEDVDLPVVEVVAVEDRAAAWK